MEIVKNVEKVLINEIDNRNGVYMYLEDNAWCAYERSAYFLAKLKVPVVIKREVVRGGYDIILLKASVAVDDLNLPLAPKTVLKLVADDNLQFLTSEKFEGFQEWKAAQLSKLPA